MSRNLLWIDIETTGLNFFNDTILEIGFAQTNPKGHILRMKNWLIPQQINYDEDMNQVVKKMHKELLPQIYVCSSSEEYYQKHQDVEKEMMEWIVSNDLNNQPLCGSSVHFDRHFIYEQFPQLHNLFHYRNLDVSTLKICWQNSHPESQVEGYEDPRPKDRKQHRALPDIVDSIREWAWYMKTFGLWTTESL